MYALHQKRIPKTIPNDPIDDPATKKNQYYSLLRLLPLQRNQYLPSATAGLLSWISATGNLHHIQKKVHQARLKNMLVCCYLGLLFWVHPVGQKYVFFFFPLKMEKIALILVYLTWFSNSSLSLISCVYFFCNVRATIMNLTYFNSHNLQLADLHETSFPRLSLLPPSPWMGWMDGDHVLRHDLVQRHQIKII